MGGVLPPIDGDPSFAQEEELDRRLFSGPERRAGIDLDKTDLNVAFRERTKPLVGHARRTVRDPRMVLRMHEDDIVVSRLRIHERRTCRFFVASLEAVLIVPLASLVEISEDAVLELPFFLEYVVCRFPLGNAQKAAAARATKLTHHHLEPLGPVLRAVRDAFREIGD